MDKILGGKSVEVGKKHLLKCSWVFHIVYRQLNLTETVATENAKLLYLLLYRKDAPRYVQYPNI